MKIKANIILVNQLEYISERFLASSEDKCIGCIFDTTREVENSMCEKVNENGITCSGNRIWIIDESMWNSCK